MHDPTRWRPSARFGRTAHSNTILPPPSRRGSFRLWIIAAASFAVVAAVALFIGLTRPSEAAVQPGGPLGTVDPLVAQGATRNIITPSPKPYQSEDTAMDLSDGVMQVHTSEENINLPGMIYGQMLYSAGTGTARLPVLKDLYHYDMLTQTETKVAEASVLDGEIYETILSQRWFVFIDTNQNGNNQLCYIDRFKDPNEVMLIKETEYALPKLRLSDDYLVWIEQTEEKTDDIWFFSLGNGDNFPITTITDNTTYGVSAPSVFGKEVIWADHDPEQSEAERAVEEHSAIYVCDLDSLSGDNIVFEYFRAGMYVHEPITNGEAWAWIDSNWAPGSGLYFKYRNGSNVMHVTTGVTSYALGDGILVYTKNMQVWAYFYRENIYARLTPAGGAGMQPVVAGRYVAWYDLSGDTDIDKIVYKEALLPGETPLPTPTLKPTPTPAPTPSEIIIVDVEDDGGDGGGSTPSSPTPNPNP